jgi:peptide-methionine (S)-S-oxide reductase
MDQKITTALRPFEVFYEAEAEHQDYYNRNRSAPYCRAIIEPRLRRLGVAD